MFVSILTFLLRLSYPLMAAIQENIGAMEAATQLVLPVRSELAELVRVLEE